MDHEHSDFGQNCASNPALFSKCNIIWKDTWDKDSMLSIIKEELREDTTIESKKKEEIYNYFIGIHKICME